MIEAIIIIFVVVTRLKEPHTKKAKCFKTLAMKTTKTIIQYQAWEKIAEALLETREAIQRQTSLA